MSWPPKGESPPTAKKAGDASVVRPRIGGKFVFVGERKYWVRGTTYGTFRPDPDGHQFPSKDIVEADFAKMAECGLNSVRVYTVPPRWLLDVAHCHDLRVMVGLPWEQHIAFLDDPRTASQIVARVRSGVATCAGHPAVLCYAIGNEIPAHIVRWYGRDRIQKFLKRVYLAAKAEDPLGLVTYVNYPSTEYLDLPFLDIFAFNVYLETEDRLSAYLARIQNLAGDRPLLMAEIGLDSRRNTLQEQADVLDWQVRTSFRAACCGAFIFSWTDEWYRGGHDINDWDFGLTDRNRAPKPALEAVSGAFGAAPFDDRHDWPAISVVVCSYNGAPTIRDTLEALQHLDYPRYEVIVVDDGSTDATAEIAGGYDVRLISTENAGLSSARNTGMEAATGEIVAYIDDDAYPDTHWLKFLAAEFLSSDYAGVGGPNIAPPGDGAIAECIANSPGGPSHVLLTDRTAEHIPGCNMAFRRDCLKAVGGFDPRFRAAGDDVDVCWRLQDRGWLLGFNPGAMVWHHRRNSLRTYWKQQLGYGKAESLLERKWPEKYNPLGHLTWAGRLYGGGLSEALARRNRVYQGTWGSAPFQALYQQSPAGLSSALLMPEWYLVISVLAGFVILSAAWTPLLVFLPLLVMAIAGTVLQAVAGGARALFREAARSRLEDWKRRSLTGLLHLLQPLARLIGRLRHGLTPWRHRGASAFAIPRQRSLERWDQHWHTAEDRLSDLERGLREQEAAVIRGGDFDRWDLETRTGAFGAVRCLVAIEEHGGGAQLVRLRIWPRIYRVPALAMTGLTLLAVAAAGDRAWLAATIFALAVAWLLGRSLRDCGDATGLMIGQAGSLGGTDLAGKEAASHGAAVVLADQT